MVSSSSSVLSQIGTDSSATYSEISGTCGTGLSRVLARMKALRSGIMLALCIQQRECVLPAIKPDRLLGDLYKLRTFGTYKTGVHRPTFSPEDIAARAWFAERCTEAGLETTIDGIGNILGKSKAGGPKALSGSHLESQNHAGWLDGALGCVYALEAARAIKEAGGDTGVDVVVFADEEGHFGSFLGSKSFTGLLTDADIDKAKDKTNGTPMRDALQAAGYAGCPRLVVEPERYDSFFEAHIEQGASLEGEEKRIGVVTAIVAIWQYGITVTGEQNHAGTTSM